MAFFQSQEPEGCPVRHPESIIGSCSLCRKTVCPSCCGLKGRDKIICQKCMGEMKDREEKKDEEKSFWQKLLYREKKSVSELKEDEECNRGRHHEETIGSCNVCKKSVCPACTSPKKVGGKEICNPCFRSLFQVRDQVKEEEQRRFVAGIKGFVNFLGFGGTVTLVVMFILIGITCGVLSFFHLLHPESFDSFDDSWREGNYGDLLVRDVPALFDEMGERFWYEWWYEYSYRQSYEDWKKDQLEDENTDDED